jgi:mannose-6-phosphate isomerase-like protein (cupin superfamily)
VEKLAADYGQVAVLGMPFKDKPVPERMITKPLEGATVFPYIAVAKEMPAFWYENGLWSILADSNQTGGVYTMIEKLVPKGRAEKPHIHLGQDEVFYILEGSATFLVSDRLEKAAPGDLLFIPRGTIHGFRVDSETLLFLNIHTPAGIEKLLPILADVAAERTLPPPNFKPKAAITDGRKADLFKQAGIVFPAVVDPLL